jgi:hypothetical protein
MRRAILDPSAGKLPKPNPHVRFLSWVCAFAIHAFATIRTIPRRSG